MGNKLENIKIGESYFVKCENKDQRKTFDEVNNEANYVMIQSPFLTLMTIQAEGGIIVVRVNSAPLQTAIRLTDKKKKADRKKKEEEAVKKRKEQRAIKKEADEYLINEARNEKRLKRETKEAVKAEHQKGVLERKKAREDKKLADTEKKETPKQAAIRVEDFI